MYNKCERGADRRCGADSGTNFLSAPSLVATYSSKGSSGNTVENQMRKINIWKWNVPVDVESIV